MLNLHLLAAITANQMMMVCFRDLVSQMPIFHVGRVSKPILCKKLESTIYGRFSNIREFLKRSFIYLQGREMSAGMTENMQDRMSLRGHTISAGTELRSIFF